jgi:hypothetical protein
MGMARAWHALQLAGVRRLVIGSIPILMDIPGLARPWVSGGWVVLYIYPSLSGIEYVEIAMQQTDASHNQITSSLRDAGG